MEDVASGLSLDERPDVHVRCPCEMSTDGPVSTDGKALGRMGKP